MCGITGYLYTQQQQIQSTDIVRNMLALQQHRGPDDSGIVAFSLQQQLATEVSPISTQQLADTFEGVLGFNRLSILDLSANGHQPMCSPDGKVILAMNGEIYNAFDWKPQLQKAGYTFKSTTDTEVVLALYLQYGFEGMVTKLNGMFGIVVIDLRLQALYITRDRFGIKPLYCYQQNNVLAFSSEIKCFYALPEFMPELNETVLDEYLVYRNTLHNTLLKNVQQLEPGYFYCFTPHQGLKRTRFFDINSYQRSKGKPAFETAQQNLQQWLTNSVRSQLMSDVKLGCQLSGGIDSTLVTWLAKEIKQDNLLESVSIVFDNANFSEKKYIDEVASQLGIISHQFPLQANFYQQQFEKATWHFEQPINHPNTIGIFLLAQQAKQYVTVLLSGEGADEVFGGYSRFYAASYPYQNKHFWAGLKNAGPQWFSFLKYYADPFHRANINVAFMQPLMATNILPRFNYENATTQRRDIYQQMTGSIFDKQVKYDVSTYLPDLLIRQDKMSMAHSIENRVPFLDNELVAQSFTLPAEYLLRKKAPETRNTEKYLLKKLCASVFGNQFAFRNKMGFGIPIREFMSSPVFSTYLKDEVLPAAKNRGLLNTALFKKWIENPAAINQPALDALWVITGFEIWAKQFIDKK
jgi:asparagine synthase (glutamine-hydrolysing)